MTVSIWATFCVSVISGSLTFSFCVRICARCYIISIIVKDFTFCNTTNFIFLTYSATTARKISYISHCVSMRCISLCLIYNTNGCL